MKGGWDRPKTLPDLFRQQAFLYAEMWFASGARIVLAHRWQLVAIVHENGADRRFPIEACRGGAPGRYSLGVKPMVSKPQVSS